MAGIAQALNEIVKLSLGDTAIAKVSLGDELVWPSVPVGDTGLIQISSEYKASSSTVTIPATWQVGELAISHQRANTNGGAPANGSMTGWTLIGTTTGDRCRTSSYYKIVTSGDLGANFSGLSGITTGFILERFQYKNTSGVVGPITQVSILQESFLTTGAKPAQHYISVVDTSTNMQNIAIYAGRSGSSGELMTDGVSAVEEFFNGGTYIKVKKCRSSVVTTGEIYMDSNDTGEDNALCSYVLRAY